ncbi:Ribonuclease P protein subunit p20 [Merluccius polli]|uniref:Ribonuclease P protein subunit p20 n=1 Tax=Merluccius polli TaxID=89951 RepID=A0AA47M517_MERPO|nr:Ribonuclease P protein subunit p20 [Merluccius polli]
MTDARSPGAAALPQTPTPDPGGLPSVDMDPVEYTLRKRLPRKLPKRRNDVYVNMKTDFRAQLARCQKLLEGGGGGGHREICVHGLGLAINRAINIALQLQASSQGALQLAANTSTVELVDDLEPDDPDEATGEPLTRTRNNSAIHIKEEVHLATQEVHVHVKQFRRRGYPPCLLPARSASSRDVVLAERYGENLNVMVDMMTKHGQVPICPFDSSDTLIPSLTWKLRLRNTPLVSSRFLMLLSMWPCSVASVTELRSRLSARCSSHKPDCTSCAWTSAWKNMEGIDFFPLPDIKVDAGLGNSDGLRKTASFPTQPLSRAETEHNTKSSVSLSYRLPRSRPIYDLRKKMEIKKEQEQT